MTLDQLVSKYPWLYHMAMQGSWPQIQKFGLLSTEKLLKLFEVPEPLRSKLLTERRAGSVEITHAKCGKAIVRDQIPLIESKLGKALRGGMTPSQWYRLLNERIFFWVTEERLRTLLKAKAYRAGEHDVLTVDTSALLRDYAELVHLAAMNTGNTQPIAHPRGPDTFKSIADYPYEDRLKRGLEPLIEFTVLGGVTDVQRYVLKVERWAKGKLVDELYRR